MNQRGEFARSRLWSDVETGGSSPLEGTRRTGKRFRCCQYRHAKASGCRSNGAPLLPQSGTSARFHVSFVAAGAAGDRFSRYCHARRRTPKRGTPKLPCRPCSNATFPIGKSHFLLQRTGAALIPRLAGIAGGPGALRPYCEQCCWQQLYPVTRRFPTCGEHMLLQLRICATWS